MPQHEVPLVPLVDAGIECGDYQVAWKALIRGELEGRRVGSRWMVTRESLTRFLRRRSAKPNRRAGAGRVRADSGTNE
jgi:hypothetical protein